MRTTKSTWRSLILATAGMVAAAGFLAVPQLQTQDQPQEKTQSPARREFEVASIRPNNSGPQRFSLDQFVSLPGGRFYATNVTLMDVIVRVYATRRIQMQGGPDWIDSARFDIVAKADETEGEVKPEQWNQMVQTLLKNRFKLMLHRETKQMSAYALVVGKNPPKLQEPKEGEQTGLVPGAGGQMNFQRMPMAGLVNTLSNIFHTPVVDGTGIKGFYDFTLDPSQFATTGGIGSPQPANSYADLVLTAVQEQLGFKLEKRKEPLEITIIDHVEQPSEN